MPLCVPACGMARFLHIPVHTFACQHCAKQGRSTNSALLLVPKADNHQHAANTAAIAASERLSQFARRLQTRRRPILLLYFCRVSCLHSLPLRPVIHSLTHTSTQPPPSLSRTPLPAKQLTDDKHKQKLRPRQLFLWRIFLPSTAARYHGPPQASALAVAHAR